MGNVCVNPTMLDPTTYRWQVQYQLSPFYGYLPLTREELDTSNDKEILIRTCQKILKNLVADYKKRIDGVKIFFHLEDAVEFCLSESTLVFDVIDCSNLADHIGLVHLINGCEKILADTPGAMLFTETERGLEIVGTFWIGICRRNSLLPIESNSNDLRIATFKSRGTRFFQTYE